MEDCPRCNAKLVGGNNCPQCGFINEKKAIWFGVYSSWQWVLL